ncbi:MULTISPECIES: MamI family restriction endonuclease [Bacillus]|uniref:MamI family restriction endonuclease n=1 Tax=Bacillus TaxID=1386 RepID=UPI00148F0B87|nr:MamI family restriction endonuclease [Bacillus paranthracis]NOP81338.1 MamI family restriction endonuclease [Bacillus paranthracis]
MEQVLDFLKLHHESFFNAHQYANQTAQPTPEDSRAWSQILVSLLTGINGLGRKKGSDLLDGSDVKAANTWGAIDTPRFNGVIKSGTKSTLSGKMEFLDTMPYLFFVLWDNEPQTNKERTRVWVVQPPKDTTFRGICEEWYKLRSNGEIRSDNFQLHPPRNKNSNEFRNTCGNLNYPLLFCALWNGEEYELSEYNESVLETGNCTIS